MEIDPLDKHISDTAEVYVYKLAMSAKIPALSRR
jgi:hypothetical protein